MTRSGGSGSGGGASAAEDRDPLRLLLRIQREEGVGGLFAGTTPRALRALVSGAVQFATYEVTQNFLLRSQ